jgi:hypothetical protein
MRKEFKLLNITLIVLVLPFSASAWEDGDPCYQAGQGIQIPSGLSENEILRLGAKLKAQEMVQLTRAQHLTMRGAHLEAAAKAKREVKYWQTQGLLKLNPAERVQLMGKARTKRLAEKKATFNKIVETAKAHKIRAREHELLATDAEVLASSAALVSEVPLSMEQINNIVGLTVDKQTHLHTQLSSGRSDADAHIRDGKEVYPFMPVPKQSESGRIGLRLNMTDKSVYGIAAGAY